MTNQPKNDEHEITPSEQASADRLDAATHGQVLDNNNLSGQEKADEMDDSLKTFTQETTMEGPVPASADNLPRELTNPSDTAYTLPEEQ